MERHTTVTRKGQITLPADIRRALRLKQGDKVTLVLSETGEAEATLKPYHSAAQRTFGILHRDGPSANASHLRPVAAEEAAAARYARTANVP